MIFFHIFICSFVFIATSSNAMLKKAGHTSVLTANLKDGYFDLGLLGPEEFSLSLDDYSPEKYPHIGAFGQGVVPHVIPQSKGLEEKAYQLAKEVAVEFEKVKERLLQAKVQCDANAHAQLIARIQSKLDTEEFDCIAEMLQDISVMSAVQGNSEHFASLLRAALEKYISKTTQEHALLAETKLQNYKDELEQKTKRNTASMADIEQALADKKERNAYRVAHLEARIDTVCKQTVLLESESALLLQCQKFEDQSAVFHKEFQCKRQQMLAKLMKLKTDVSSTAKGLT